MTDSENPKGLILTKILLFIEAIFFIALLIFSVWIQFAPGSGMQFFSLASVFSAGMLVWIFFLFKSAFTAGKYQKSHLFQTVAILFVALFFFIILAVGLWVAVNAFN